MLLSYWSVLFMLLSYLSGEWWWTVDGAGGSLLWPVPTLLTQPIIQLPAGLL